MSMHIESALREEGTEGPAEETNRREKRKEQEEGAAMEARTTASEAQRPTKGGHR